MVAVVVLPYVGDGGEGRGRRRGQDGGHGVRLRRLEDLFLNIALSLGTRQKESQRESELS